MSGLTRSESARLAHLLHIERDLHRQGLVRVGGVDEAGRGPLAGPVVAAVVVFEPGTRIPRVNDSKKLSPKAREQLYADITGTAAAWAAGIADAEEIDAINILQATKAAVRRAIGQLPAPPDYLLLDALQIGDCPIPQRSIIKGDARCFSIAAASIIAKVTRDRLMLRYHEEYPDYGFDRHKGYGTAAHLEVLERMGPSTIHRSTFYSPGFLSPGTVYSVSFRRLTRDIRSCPASELDSLEAEVSALEELLPRCEVRALRRLLADRRAAPRG